MQNLTPWLEQKFFLADGVTPNAGGKVFTYYPGTSTKKLSYVSQDGSPNTNPIILDSTGRCNLWLGTGGYKIVNAPSTDTDPPAAAIKTWDNINVSGTGGQGAGIASSISELRGLAEGAFETVQTLGYYSANGIGGGVYYWDATSTSADNGGTVIAPTISDGTGRWILLQDTPIIATQFGVKADGVADDYAALVRAVVAYQAISGSGTSLGDLLSYGAKLVLPSGNIMLSQTLDLGAFTSNITGAGMRATTLKPLAGFTGTTLLRFGVSVGDIEAVQAQLTDVNLNLGDTSISALELYGIRDGSLFQNIEISNWTPTSARPVVRLSTSGSTIDEGVLLDNMQILCGNTLNAAATSPIVVFEMDGANEVKFSNSKILGASDVATSVIGLRIGNTTICKGITLDNLSVGNFNTPTTYTGTSTLGSDTITGLSDTSKFKVDGWAVCSAGFASTVKAYKVIAVTASTIRLEANAAANASPNVGPRSCVGLLINKADNVWIDNETFENIDGPAVQLGDANTPTNIFGRGPRFYNPGVKTNMQPYLYLKAANTFDFACGNIDSTLNCFYAEAAAIHGRVSFLTNQTAPNIGGVYAHASSKVAFEAIGNGYTALIGPGAGTTGLSAAKQYFDNGSFLEADANWLSAYAPPSNKFRLRDSAGLTFLEYLATYLKAIKYSSGTSSVVDVFGALARSTGNMADGFGGYLNLEIEDDTSGAKTIGGIRYVRAGGDNTGDVTLEAYNAGTAQRALVVRGATGNIESAVGDLKITTVGKGLSVKAGSNGRINLGVVMVGGTVTVANTSVTANTLVLPTRTVSGGTIGDVTVTKNAGVGYTLTSANILDTSTFDCLLVEAT